MYGSSKRRKLSRQNAHGGYATYQRLGAYAAKYAADKIGSWWKNKTAQRQAMKSRARSSTKTSTVKTGLVRQEGSSTSMSRCLFGKNPKSQYGYTAKLSAPQYYVQNLAGANVQSGVGLQEAFIVQWLTYAQGLHNIYLTSPDAPSLTSRFLLERVHGETLFANAASFGCSMTIYDVMNRRDTPVAGFDPSSCYNNGIANEGGGAGAYRTAGTTPFESEQFNQFFKVIQKTRVDIPSGGTHRHTIDFEPNKILHAEVIASLSANNNGSLADLGIYSLVVFHGQPAHDSTTITSVTLSQASLDVVSKMEYKYRFLSEAATDWSRTNNLAASFAVGAQFVNDLVGQVQDATGLHPGTLVS